MPAANLDEISGLRHLKKLLRACCCQISPIATQGHPIGIGKVDQIIFGIAANTSSTDITYFIKLVKNIGCKLLALLYIA